MSNYFMSPMEFQYENIPFITLDEGVEKILKELKEIKGKLPAGLHIESGWADKERKEKNGDK